jgi:hypothetical protein
VVISSCRGRGPADTHWGLARPSLKKPLGSSPSVLVSLIRKGRTAMQHGPFIGYFGPPVSVRYLRAISTCFGEGDGSLAISSFISALGARTLKPMLPSSPQIWFRKYRFPKR